MRSSFPISIHAGEQTTHVSGCHAGDAVAAGLIIGMAAALAFGRLISRFLFETTPADPTVLAGVMLLFIAGALGATLGPARRATSVDPLIALKTD